MNCKSYQKQFWQQYLTFASFIKQETCSVDLDKLLLPFSMISLDILCILLKKTEIMKTQLRKRSKSITLDLFIEFQFLYSTSLKPLSKFTTQFYCIEFLSILSMNTSRNLMHKKAVLAINHSVQSTCLTKPGLCVTISRSIRHQNREFYDHFRDITDCVLPWKSHSN